MGLSTIPPWLNHSVVAAWLAHCARQCRLQKHVDKAKLKVRFCSLLDAVLEKLINEKSAGFLGRRNGPKHTDQILAILR
jgi:hypothetical protein